MHVYTLVDFIFDGRLKLDKLIEKAKSIFNESQLDEDFWYYLIWKYITYQNGSTDGTILVISLNETNYDLCAAFTLYSTKLNEKAAKEKTFEDIVREIQIDSNSSIGLITLTNYNKLVNPPFTMNDLFQALYCKANNIDVEIYYLLQKFATYLRERPADEISAEGLFNELLTFSRKIDEAYENLATRLTQSLCNNV